MNKGNGTAFIDFVKELETREQETKKKEETALAVIEDFNTKKAKKNKSEYTYYKEKYNKTDYPEFIHICKLSQKKLKQYLSGQMKEKYKKNCFIGDGYIYCKGDIPVLLTAHMDTVHKQLIQTYVELIKTDTNGNTTHTLSSPQGIGGDDRCGVYIILEILKKGKRKGLSLCKL